MIIWFQTALGLVAVSLIATAGFGWLTKVESVCVASVGVVLAGVALAL